MRRSPVFRLLLLVVVTAFLGGLLYYLTPLLLRMENTQRGLVIGGTLVLILFYFIIFRERKRGEAALAAQAFHDPLTGLYNRRFFNYRIEEELVRTQRQKQVLAILLCDLDHFKSFNDTQGHHAGDEVLKALAKSTQESIRGTDLVFRWGGDEFLVVLSNTTREGVMIAADRIRTTIRKVSQSNRLGLDLTIGIALYPEHGTRIDDLIRLAERALDIAKKGGIRIHVGEEEYQLSERSIKVVFQPIVDIISGRMIGHEALSRDPQGKLSLPELFKRYESIGQLYELKSICFRTQLQVAYDAGLKKVFLNVDFNLLSKLESVFKPPGMDVILEISEMEALHDVENRLKVAKRWQEGGFKFAIDDFGAGFISLPFIAQLVPDYIKLDRSTILQAVSSEKFLRFSKNLVLALYNYATSGIIAEGIETERELQVAKEIGIHMGQGFFLGEPRELKLAA